MINKKFLIFPRQIIAFIIGFVTVNIFGFVESITHIIDKKRDLSLDGSKLFLIPNNLMAFILINIPNIFIQILLDSFSQQVENSQSNGLKENLILYRLYDKAFGWYFLLYFFLIQMVFITGPFLAFSSFPSVDMATQDDYVRSFGMLVFLTGSAVMLLTLILSVEKSYDSLQEKQSNVKLDIIEASSKREKQKLDYLK